MQEKASFHHVRQTILHQGNLLPLTETLEEGPHHRRFFSIQISRPDRRFSPGVSGQTSTRYAPVQQIHELIEVNGARTHAVRLSPDRSEEKSLLLCVVEFLHPILAF
jgi:hypothetical protein